jgi:H-type small acid-soluble spore protein
MEVERLKEIISSADNFKVTYKNHPVWIESYDTDANIAEVRLLDNQGIEGVYIKDLVDTGQVLGKVKGRR